MTINWTINKVYIDGSIDILLALQFFVIKNYQGPGPIRAANIGIGNSKAVRGSSITKTRGSKTPATVLEPHDLSMHTLSMAALNFLID